MTTALMVLLHWPEVSLNEIVECPRHTEQFCLRNGKVLSLPATVDAAAHKVELDGLNILFYAGVPVDEVTNTK